MRNRTHRSAQPLRLPVAVASRRRSPLLLSLVHCVFVSFSFLLATQGEDIRISYRLTGLFQPDRVGDLHQQAAELPASGPNHSVEVKLLDVNYDTCVVTFSYDGAKTFKNQKPEQIQNRIDQLLRQASKGAFSISPLSTLKPEDLKKERIAVAGHDCKGCNYGLYRAIASIEGVERAIASFKEGHLTAWIDPAKTNREALVAALKKKEVSVIEEASADQVNSNIKN